MTRPASLQALIDAAQSQPEPKVSLCFEDVRAAMAVRAQAPDRRPEELQSLIDAARSQPAPKTSVQLEDVRSSIQRGRRQWVAVAAIAIAVTGLAVLAWPSAEHVAQSNGAVAEVQNDPRPQPAAVIPLEQSNPQPQDVIVDGATVRTIEGPVPTRQGELVVLDRGRYEVETQDEPVRVKIGSRTLEIKTASSVHIDASTEVVSYELVRGEASWVESPTLNETKPRPKLSARDLQRQAEQAMQAGDRSAAIDALQTLVVRHPRSTAARVGLLDLARLEKARTRRARARCAYALFLERWPDAAEAKRVRAALDDLGEGVRCKGLRPSR